LLQAFSDRLFGLFSQRGLEVTVVTTLLAQHHFTGDKKLFMIILQTQAFSNFPIEIVHEKIII
jgi:hypothetical protein